jgi:peroxiredoxin
MAEQLEEIHIAPGVHAPDVALQGEDGNAVTLSSFWTQRPTALVFVRHFG